MAWSWQVLQNEATRLEKCIVGEHHHQVSLHGVEIKIAVWISRWRTSVSSGFSPTLLHLNYDWCMEVGYERWNEGTLLETHQFSAAPPYSATMSTTLTRHKLGRYGSLVRGAIELIFLLDALVTCLAEVGLQLNVRKTKVLTTQSQSPSEVLLRNGQGIEVLDRGSTHKWLGCMLCTANTGSHTLDVAHHLHAASKAFYANRAYLVNTNVAMRDRFRYFNAMVTPVACFGAAHRKVYKQDLCKMDIVFRRLLRSIVGPPGDVDWTLPWHEILHHWNERVKFFTSRHGLKSWSALCLGQYWKFAHYISNLPRERWVVRAMNWFPENARRVGRPAYTWDSMIQHFCRHKQIGNWRERAQNFSFWMNQFDDFLSFTDTWWTWNVHSICCACLRPERAACFGMQVSLTLWFHPLACWFRGHQCQWHPNNFRNIRWMICM